MHTPDRQAFFQVKMIEVLQLCSLVLLSPDSCEKKVTSSFLDLLLSSKKATPSHHALLHTLNQMD